MFSTALQTSPSQSGKRVDLTAPCGACIPPRCPRSAYYPDPPVAPLAPPIPNSCRATRLKEGGEPNCRARYASPLPAVDSSSLECPVVSARSSCHRGDLDVQLPVFPSTWALSVVSAVISGLCFNRSASSHAEGWLCGTFRHCLLLRFQLRFLALFTPAEAVNSLGYNCTSITCVGEGACVPTSSLFLHGMPPGLFRPT